MENPLISHPEFGFIGSQIVPNLDATGPLQHHWRHPVITNHCWLFFKWLYPPWNYIQLTLCHGKWHMPRSSLPKMVICFPCFSTLPGVTTRFTSVAWCELRPAHGTPRRTRPGLPQSFAAAMPPWACRSSVACRRPPRDQQNPWEKCWWNIKKWGFNLV